MGAAPQVVRCTPTPTQTPFPQLRGLTPLSQPPLFHPCLEIPKASQDSPESTCGWWERPGNSDLVSERPMSRTLIEQNSLNMWLEGRRGSWGCELAAKPREGGRCLVAGVTGEGTSTPGRRACGAWFWP